MFGFLKSKKTKKFGEIAVDKGLVSREDITEALNIQKEYTEKHNEYKEIGAILTEKGLLTPNDVTVILEEQKNKMGRFAWFSALFHLSR